MDKELQKVAETIDNFIEEEFKINPYNFLYESDIQAILFSKLYFNFNNKKIKIKGEENNEITTNPVKTEYPTSIKKCKNIKIISRFDIGIIDEKNLKDDDGLKSLLKCNKLEKDSAFWLQKLKIGIEIKYFQSDKKPDKIPVEINDDIKKLNNYKNFIKKYYDIKNGDKINFTGIGLFFSQIPLKNYNSSSKTLKKIEINNDKIMIQLDNNKFNFKKIDNIKEHIKENEINAFLIVADEEGRSVTLFQLV